MTETPSRDGASYPAELSPQSVRTALDRVLASPAFASAHGLSKLLRYLVEEKLSEREHLLKEYSLGVDVFCRGEGFDPKRDTIVRVQARRLRVKLDAYYRGPGTFDELRFSIPKGAYVPVFHSAEAATLAGSASSNGKPRGCTYQPDPRAHAQYVEGRRLANLGTTQDLLAALEQFEASIAADENHAFSHWALADVYLQLSSTRLPPREAMPKARAAALKALELDPSLDQAHAALGAVHLRYDWNRRASLARAREALRLNPRSSEAHFLCGCAASTQGRIADALSHFQRAQELDPFSLKVRFQTQAAYLLARDYEAAIEEGLKTVRMEPRYALGRSALGMAYSLAGDHAAGLDHLRQACKMDDGPWQLLFLQHGYAFAGDRGQAQQVVDRLETLAEQRYMCAYEIGEAHAVMGSEDSAFRWLEKALEERSDCLVWMEVEPWMDCIRVAPRYSDLVARFRAAEATVNRD